MNSATFVFPYLLSICLLFLFSFLLDRLLQYEKIEESSDESVTNEMTDLSDAEDNQLMPVILKYSLTILLRSSKFYFAAI